ncbi:MAG: HD domain-containing protein [Clostridium sp.]|nr:HD domain-containing protein [Clostridium sp.]
MQRHFLGNILRLFSYILNGIDEELFLHGHRVAYILLKYLEEQGKYSEYEISQMVQIAILHDIGACKLEEKLKHNESITGYLNNHSVWGYIFLENYTIYSTDMAEICLYHHLPYEKYELINSKYKEIARLFNILNDSDDIGKNKMVLDMEKILKPINQEFTKEVGNIFSEINKDDILYNKIITGVYKKELYDYLDTIEIDKEGSKQFVKMIIQCNNFRSRGTLEHSITVEAITYNLYKLLKIEKEDMDTILFSAFCHDLGKFLVPIEILEKPAKLTYEEMEIMKEHAIYTGMILKELGLKDVGRIAELHHEKLDGSGYPYGLKDKEIPIQAKMLTVADVFSALTEKRSYKEEFSRDKTINILKSMAKDNKIDKDIVKVVVDNYDYLVNVCEEIREKNNFKYKDMLRQYNQINNEYEELCIDKTVS